MRTRVNGIHSPCRSQAVKAAKTRSPARRRRPIAVTSPAPGWPGSATGTLGRLPRGLVLGLATLDRRLGPVRLDRAALGTARLPRRPARAGHRARRSPGPAGPRPRSPPMPAGRAGGRLARLAQQVGVLGPARRAARRPRPRARRSSRPCSRRRTPCAAAPGRPGTSGSRGRLTSNRTVLRSTSVRDRLFGSGRARPSGSTGLRPGSSPDSSDDDTEHQRGHHQDHHEDEEHRTHDADRGTLSAWRRTGHPANHQMDTSRCLHRGPFAWAGGCSNRTSWPSWRS